MADTLWMIAGAVLFTGFVFFLVWLLYSTLVCMIRGIRWLRTLLRGEMKWPPDDPSRKYESGTGSV